MKGSDGPRRRTRSLRISPRDRGKASIRAVLQKFQEKDIVSIYINPSYQKMPDPHFHGFTGRVVGSQGRAYFVQLRDGGMQKRVLVAPEHLRRVA
jgi:large subunit ribosomal protein L21e